MKKKETFTKVPDNILSNKELTPTQKLIISYVLRWQSSGRICFESNGSLAQRFGLSVPSLKKHITQLNKRDFFLSEETSERNEFGKWSNSKRMIVDQTMLQLFLKVSVGDKSKLSIIDLANDTFANFEEFKLYVKEYSKGKASDKSISYHYQLLKNEGAAITKEKVHSLFRKGN